MKFSLLTGTVLVTLFTVGCAPKLPPTADGREVLNISASSRAGYGVQGQKAFNANPKIGAEEREAEMLAEANDRCPAGFDIVKRGRTFARVSSVSTWVYSSIDVACR